MLYVLAEARMFFLKAQAIDVIEVLEAKTSINNAARQLGHSNQDVKAFLEILQAMVAGTFFSGPCFIEKLRIVDPIFNETVFRSQSNFLKLHVYLTGRCSMNCGHCTCGNVLRARPCEGCARIPGIAVSDTDLETGLLKKTLREAGVLGCRQVEFHVGDSAMVSDLLVAAIFLAGDESFSRIELVTGSGLPASVLKVVLESNVQVTFQVYGGEAKIHDAVCGQKKTFDRILQTISQLQEKKQKYSLLYVPQTEEEVDSSRKRLLLLRPHRLMIDRQLSSGCFDGANHSRALADSCIEVPDVKAYLASLEMSCMFGQFSLAPDGSLYVCPFVENTKVGNLGETTISEILCSGTQQSFWRKGACARDGCLSCPLRLACKLCPVTRGVLPEGECNLALSLSERQGMCGDSET